MKKVFLIYDSRSGSTMLAALLDAFESISVIPETNFIDRIISHGESKFDAMSVAEKVEFLCREPHFLELELNPETLGRDLEASRCQSALAAVIDVVFAHYFSGHDGQVDVGVLKCGGTLFHTERVREVVPDAEFLHIVRDGRAVCASKIHSTDSWGKKFDSSVYGNARHWARRMDVAGRCQDQIVEVRYEDLIGNEAPTIEYVLDRLGVPKESRVKSQGYESYKDKIGARQKHLHTNVGQPNPDSLDKWRTQLTDSDVAVFEFIAHQQLRRHGYEPVFPNGYYRRNGINFAFSIVKHYFSFWASRIARLPQYTREGRFWERFNLWRRA